MNKFYEFEDLIFENKEEAKMYKKKTGYYTAIAEIKTEKTYEQFYDSYNKARREGNSILDSIEWAK